MTEDASGLHEDPEANVGRSVLCLSGASWVQVLFKHLFVAHFLPLSSTSSVSFYTMVPITYNLKNQISTQGIMVRYQARQGRYKVTAPYCS
jgi:hypothetical protein